MDLWPLRTAHQTIDAGLQRTIINHKSDASKRANILDSSRENIQFFFLCATNLLKFFSWTWENGYSCRQLLHSVFPNFDFSNWTSNIDMEPITDFFFFCTWQMWAFLDLLLDWLNHAHRYHQHWFYLQIYTFTYQLLWHLRQLDTIVHLAAEATARCYLPMYGNIHHLQFVCHHIPKQRELVPRREPLICLYL